MAGVEGKITRSKKGRRETVYLSNVFGMWPEGKNLKLSHQRGNQKFHIYIGPKDGQIYDVLKELYEQGMNLS